MESILQDIKYVIEVWLLKGEQNFKIDTLQARIRETVMQIEMEGEHSMVDMRRIQRITDLWSQILDLLYIEKSADSKRQMITKVLELFNFHQISLDFTSDIIYKYLCRT